MFYQQGFESTVNVKQLDIAAEGYEKLLKQKFRQVGINKETLTGEEHEDIYSLYYRRWRRFIDEYVQDDGSIKKTDIVVPLSTQSQLLRSPTSTWSFIGPKAAYSKYSDNNAQPQIAANVNNYAIDMAKSNHDVLYAAPETGGIFKTTDRGLNWALVLDQPNIGNEEVSTYSGDPFFSIAVHPTNPDIVYVGRENLIKKIN